MPKLDCRQLRMQWQKRPPATLVAPAEYKDDDATASAAEGLRDACIEYGIPIEPGDVAYYVNTVTAKCAQKFRPPRISQSRLTTNCANHYLSAP